MMFQKAQKPGQSKSSGDSQKQGGQQKSRLDPFKMLEEQKQAIEKGSQPLQMLLKEEEEKTTQKKEEEKELQAKKENKEVVPQETKSGTKAKLPDEVQTKMEGAFGTSFADVNIHKDDNSATDMGALAYTQGKDVHFAPGQYNPGTQKGQELIGHELTHVEQQKAGRVQPTKQGKGMAVNDNPALEKEADVMGKKASQGKSVDIHGKAGGVQKKEAEGKVSHLPHAQGQVQSAGDKKVYITAVYSKAGEKYSGDKFDTLYSISKRLGVAMDELINLNPTIKPDELLQGQQIILPSENKDNETEKAPPVPIINEPEQPGSVSDKFATMKIELENQLKGVDVAPGVKQKSLLYQLLLKLDEISEAMRGDATMKFGIVGYGRGLDGTDSPATKLAPGGKIISVVDFNELFDMMDLLVSQYSNQSGRGVVAGHKEKMGEFSSRFSGIKDNLKNKQFDQAIKDIDALRQDFATIKKELDKTFKKEQEVVEKIIPTARKESKNAGGGIKRTPGTPSSAESPTKEKIAETVKGSLPEEKQKLSDEESRYNKLIDVGLIELYFFYSDGLMYYTICPKNGTTQPISKEEALNSKYKNVLKYAIPL